MKNLENLIAGYRAFLRERYPRRAPLYRSLATRGQSPRIMVVTSADSRLDPEALFGAEPGELYILRNVAGLIPPHEPLGFHGTSATLEYAVRDLQVAHILVLGHSQCASVQRFIEKTLNPGSEGTDYIDTWLSLLRGLRGDILAEAKSGNTRHLQRQIEQKAVGISLDNIQSFPFVREAMVADRLTLHGGYFDLMTGLLWSLDQSSRTFEPIDGLAVDNPYQVSPGAGEEARPPQPQSAMN